MLSREIRLFKVLLINQKKEKKTLQWLLLYLLFPPKFCCEATNLIGFLERNNSSFHRFNWMQMWYNIYESTKAQPGSVQLASRWFSLPHSLFFVWKKKKNSRCPRRQAIISGTAKSIRSFQSSLLFVKLCLLNVAEGRLVNLRRSCTRLSQFHLISLLINLLIALRVTVPGCTHGHNRDHLQAAAGASCWRKTLVAPETALDNWIKSRSYCSFKNNFTARSSHVIHAFWLSCGCVRNTNCALHNQQQQIFFFRACPIMINLRVFFFFGFSSIRIHAHFFPGQLIHQNFPL